MKAVRAFFRSMTGRIFAILAVGMGIAAAFTGLVTSYIAARDFERQAIEGVAEHIAVYTEIFDAIPAHMRSALLFDGGAANLRYAPDVTGGEPDRVIENALATRGGVAARVRVNDLEDFATCFPNHIPEYVREVWESEEVRQALTRAANNRTYKLMAKQALPPRCRLVEMQLSDGQELKFALGTQGAVRESVPLFQPAGLLLLAAAIMTLAYLVARFATRPLINLSDAASDLGQNLDRPPILVRGPTEVRQAARAFNAMQKQIQDHVAERTRMLAAITHDLQTPLTRLRLRLERVEDESLRERLVLDLQEMKALIDEGLELARSADTAEQCVRLDLDSLLESLIEDAADAGRNATFSGGCGAVLNVQPLAMRRLFTNLIENAIKYGGSASVSAERTESEVLVRIRDQGPGLPQEMLDRVFDPFMRLEHSRSRETGGAGLGLTIARMLGQRNGATVSLRNHPEGGLEAIVRWDKRQAVSDGAIGR